MEHQEPTYYTKDVSPDVVHAVVRNEMYNGQRPFDEEIAYSYAIEMMQRSQLRTRGQHVSFFTTS